jgi:hypothetical protein
MNPKKHDHVALFLFLYHKVLIGFTYLPNNYLFPTSYIPSYIPTYLPTSYLPTYYIGLYGLQATYLLTPLPTNHLATYLLIT